MFSVQRDLSLEKHGIISWKGWHKDRCVSLDVHVVFVLTQML